MRAGIRTAAPWLKRMINWRDLQSIGEAAAHGADILEFHAAELAIGTAS